ncbi:MAG: hypothetical protein ACYDEA_08515 [Candidatus Dormibacteria bacterium]
MSRSRLVPWTVARAHAKSLSASVLALVAVAYLSFVYYFGVNVPFQDEWAVVILYRLTVRGQLTLTALWTQHNENRMLFPNLLMLGLDHVSHFNTKVEMYGSVLMLTVAVALLALLYRRTTGSSPLWFIPAGFVLFSWTQYAVALQGFAIALYLVLLSLAVSLAALAAARLRPALFFVAIAAATIASYSSTQGLAVWAAGLVFLLARGYPRSRLWLWLASASVISAIYWIGFIWADTGGGVRWALANPGPSLNYLYLLVGSTIPSSQQLGIGPAVQAGVGAALLLASLGAFGYWRWRRASGEWLAVPLALIAFAVLIDFLITIGRAHLGTQTATSSRYTLFNLWLFAGVWLAYAAILSRSHLRAARVAVILLAGLSLLQIVGAYHSGLIEGRITKVQREQAVALVRHYQTAPADQVVPLVYQLYPGFKPLAGFLAHQHLSVFYDPKP